MTAGASALRDRVGIVGLGTMGSILARRLLEHGVALTVFNRSPAPVAALRCHGAAAAETPHALAGSCDTVFTVLTGPDALSEVLFGEYGLADGWACRECAPVLCDLSTQDPARLQQMAVRAAKRGIRLVHAPMAGSVHDATHGTLKFLYGGDRDILIRLSPCFAAWGPSPTPVGSPYQAATAKLALNLLVGVMAQGLAESLRLLHRCDIAADRFLEVLAASGLDSPLYQRLGQRYLQGDAAVRFSLANLYKDIGFCKAHPAWGEHRPVLLDALHNLLEGVSPPRSLHDYSSLLRLEQEPL